MQTWEVHSASGKKISTFLHAVALSVRERVLDLGWLKDLKTTASENPHYEIHRTLEWVKAPDGKAFVGDDFFAITAKKTDRPKKICCEEKRIFDLLPHELGYLCAISGNEIGVFGVRGKTFLGLCRENHAILTFVQRLFIRRPDLWTKVSIQLSPVAR
ncbi:MAG: hypothetical protein ACE5OY_08220 [Candidatus Bathyarchaeia archaeon]